jgi:hypothetical protein
MGIQPTKKTMEFGHLGLLRMAPFPPRIWILKRRRGASHTDSPSLGEDSEVPSSSIASTGVKGVHVHAKITGTGWWFGTCFIFPYIENNNPN